MAGQAGGEGDRPWAETPCRKDTAHGGRFTSSVRTGLAEPACRHRLTEQDLWGGGGRKPKPHARPETTAKGRGKPTDRSCRPSIVSDMAMCAISCRRPAMSRPVPPCMEG